MVIYKQSSDLKSSFPTLVGKQFAATVQNAVGIVSEQEQQQHDKDASATSKHEKQSSTTTPALNTQAPSPYASIAGLQNTCSGSAGARVLFATDEWFASADNLLVDGPPQFDPDLYCEQGKVMDGWESRRRREEGHDWCIIQLSKRCTIVAVEVDTAHFTGNNTPMISLQVCDAHGKQLTDMVSELPGAVHRLIHRGGPQGHGHTPAEVAQAAKACQKVEWQELLPKTPLLPGYQETRMHYFDTRQVTGTHLRVNYYPDGGVSRLRLWAKDAPQVAPKPKPLYLPITTGKICTVVPHSSKPTADEMPSQLAYDFPELSSTEMGGKGIACSNHHYGEPANLLQPNLGVDMSDGWETARHPNRPGVLHKNAKTGLIDSDLLDWSILQLGSVAAEGVARVLLDTKHFRGNYPESVLVEGCLVEPGTTPKEQLLVGKAEWFPLVKRTRMAPNAEHVFDCSLNQVENGNRAVSHVRVSVFPDGGLSRVRIYGQPSEGGMHSHL